MLTRLKVNGFKNLVNVDVRFGAFTCIAGANGVGKSNLFDAINFLSDLADKTLVDAATSVRDKSGKTSDLRGIFNKYQDLGSKNAKYADEMSFEAEMIISKEGVDDLGQTAVATSTFLRYSLRLRYRNDNDFSSIGGLEILEEKLVYLKIGKSRLKESILFENSDSWRDSLILNSRTVDYISTEKDLIVLHTDGKQGGKPVRRTAEKLPRTVLSSTNAVENPTALIVKNEMRSWRLLQLEPSALRRPSEFNSAVSLGADGANIASTVYHLAQLDTRHNGNNDRIETSKVYGNIANRLSELIDDVYEIGVDRDEKRELLTLQLTTRNKVSYPAKSLSDGTLRFLALAVLELDSNNQGVLCLEEPENGIHPQRIPAILRLLKDIAVDTNERVGRDNPLRQVIINTHSPVVVQQIEDSDLLSAERKENAVSFSCLSNTWRTKDGDTPIVSKGKILAYLNPVNVEETSPNQKAKRIVDREDFKPYLNGVIWG
jgi:predicted ATPase